MAEQGEKTLEIRPPFAPIDGLASDRYRIATIPGDSGRITITAPYEGAAPKPLKLAPAFPGELTFKPAANASIPTDPTAPGAAPITGNLYLQIAGWAAQQYSQATKDKRKDCIEGSEIIAYLGITLTSAFFRELVHKGAASSQSKELRITWPATATQAAHAFAKGLLSFNIEATGAKQFDAFPEAAPNPTAKTSAATVAMGVRANYNPYAPPALVDLSDAQILAAPDFVPLSPLFWYRALRNDETIVSSAQRNHPFFKAIERFDRPEERVRRLRIFLHSERGERLVPIKAFDGLSARALDAAGKKELWSQPLNRLGLLFVGAADSTNFRFELRDGTTSVKLGLKADNAQALSLELSWEKSDDDKERTIDLSAYLDVTGDPLDLPDDKTLSLFMYDSCGLTLDPLNKTVFAYRELVRPLQKLLTNLGFGVAKDEVVAFGSDQKDKANPELFKPVATRNTYSIPGDALARKAGVYDIATRHAVREFQREARTATRMIGNQLAPPADVKLFTGLINGSVDKDTRTILRDWRTKGYRCALTFYIVKGGKSTNDIGFADRSNIDAKVFDGSKTQLGKISKFTDEPTGIFSFGVTNSGSDGNAFRAEILKEARYTGEKWEKRAILAVAFNESKAFDAVNGCDIAYLSMGLFQWTIGKKQEPGELPGNCDPSVLGQESFNRLFGTYGLAVTERKPECHRYVATFTLDGNPLTPDMKEEFRGFRWAHRFRAAFQDEAMHLVQYESARNRLSAILAIKGIPFGKMNIKLKELLQSQLLCAMALDLHVNAPCVLVRELSACAAALQNPKLIVDFTNGSPTSKWYDAMYKAALKQKQEKTKKAASTLTPEELAPWLAELYKLRLSCEDAARPDAQLAEAIKKLNIEDDVKNITRSNTATLTVTGDTLATMSQAQHDALAALFRWRRNYSSGMYDPDGRWKAIANGGYDDGTIGKLQTKPKQFTE